MVFAVAGVSKLADREGSRKAIADFGVPTTLSTPGKPRADGGTGDWKPTSTRRPSWDAEPRLTQEEDS